MIVNKNKHVLVAEFQIAQQIVRTGEYLLSSQLTTVKLLNAMHFFAQKDQQYVFTISIKFNFSFIV